MNYTLAFLSGATSGLGKALSFFLAKQGIPLFLTSRHEKELLSLQSELELFVPVSCLAADLLSTQDMEILLSKLKECSPDLVVNNAGAGLYGNILTYPLQDQMSLLQLNAMATTQITIESARTLIRNKRKGTILNLSSAAGFFTYPSFTLYSASKAFLTHFSASFDQEVSPYGVRILCCCPGQMDTDFRFKAARKSPHPVSRLGTMSRERIVKLIWKQIERQKACQIIDFRYRLMCFLAKYFLTKRFLSKFLRKQLSKRYQERTFY